MSSPSISARTSGFTLIEALIAIVLISAVLPVALAGISRVSQSVSRMQKQAIATRLAEARLALWLMDGSWQTAAPSGEFTPSTDGEDSSAFHWQLAVTPWTTPTVQNLTVTVTWDPPTETNAISLATLATPPSAAAAATTAVAP